jgi:hypothetical protein
VISAADGAYTLTAGVGTRVVIHVQAAGFAKTFQVARVSAGKTASLDVQLLPTGVTRSVSIAVGDTVTVPDSTAQVTIPAGGLVPASGGTSAASVNVAVTPINPAIDPDVMPGDYTAVLSGGGSPVPIESFGALLLDVSDESGTRYTLAPGQTSTIRIPVGTLSASPPPTIPLLIFDESTGLWAEEGTATLAGTAPNQFYEGTVARFGFWNADQAMNTVFVSGCVLDTANQPIANVMVKTNGINYSGSASTFTAADGSFQVAVRRDALATLSVTFDRNGSPLTTTVNVGPFTADSTLPDCIVTEPAPLGITARSLPTGIVGTGYNARLAAFNGTKPYSWSVLSGVLPTGLTLDNTTGQISGAPTAAGTFTGTIQAQDSSTPQQSATAPFSITIFPTSSGGGGLGNNSALLRGAAIGKGTVAVGDLRKQIAVTVLGQNDSLTVGTAFANRSTTTSNTAYVILPVTNTGSQTLCFVELEEITYRDAGGAALTVPSLTFVRGSVRKVSANIFTDTCLAPGETGMVADIEANLYSAVAKMEFTFKSGSSVISVPAARVIPQSYIQPTTTSLAVTVANLGSAPALVGAQFRFHHWFLFDDAMQPLLWGITDTTAPSIISASGMATISDNVFYDGSGSRLLVFVDFEDTTGTTTSSKAIAGITGVSFEDCATSMPADELAMCRHKRRNLRSATLASVQQAPPLQTE